MRGKFLVALVLVLAVFAAGQKPSKKVLQQKKRVVRVKAIALRSKLKKTKRQMVYVVADIQKADTLLEVARQKLDKTQRRLVEARLQQEEITQQLDEATGRLKIKKELVAKRIRVLYMQGNPGPLQAFIGADSFSEVADRTYVIQKIADQDDALLTEFKQQRAIVAIKKRQKDAIVGQIASLRQQQLNAKKDLAQRKQAKNDLLGQLRDTQQETLDELGALEKESNAIEAELRKYYGSGMGGPVYRGNFRLPVTGRMTSPFGYRIHPILRTRKLHTGLDLAAPMGTPIRAAGDGRVIYSGYRGGYGYCIMIDHGGGTSTLYAHSSRLYVGVGKIVKAGDIIAAVGSTGFSTGPHCHFEVRVYGKPVNPLGR